MAADVDALGVGRAGMIGVTAQIPPNRTVDAISPIDPENKRVALSRRLIPLVLGKPRSGVLHHRRVRRNVGARKKAISVNRRSFGEHPLVVVPPTKLIDLRRPQQRF